MKKSFLPSGAITILISLLAFSSLFAQEKIVIDSGEIYVMDAPETFEVCEFSPTGINANYHLKANDFIRQGKRSKQAAIIEADYVSACGSEQFPEEAKSAFEYAAQIWGEYINSSVPIRVEATWESLGGNVLGSAGPTRIISLDPPDGVNDTWYTIAQASAITGDNIKDQIAGENYDIVINFSCDFSNWYFGEDANTPSGQIDFVSVALHELGHGLGFIGSVRGDSDAESASWGFGSQGYPIIYDRFTEDGSARSIINTSVYGNPSQALYGAVTGQEGGVFFTGTDARNVNEGSPVKLFSPSQWQGGSSYSHLDQQTFTNTENALMRPSIDAAFAIHSPGPIFCGMFSDMGWPLGQACRDLIGMESLIALEVNNVPLEVGNEMLDFRVTNVGSSNDISLTIKNDATAEDPLNGNLSIEGGNFSVMGGLNPSFSIEPGSMQTFTIRYIPQNVRQHISELRIFHNALNRSSPIRVQLQGEALEENRQVALGQSYPNPVNSSQSIIRIPYAVPEETNVRIDLFNSLGQHISTLLNTVKQSGRYEEEVEVRGLASGMYMYRIIVGGADETRKLLIVN